MLGLAWQRLLIAATLIRALVLSISQPHLVVVLAALLHMCHKISEKQLKCKKKISTQFRWLIIYMHKNKKKYYLFAICASSCVSGAVDFDVVGCGLVVRCGLSSGWLSGSRTFLLHHCVLTQQRNFVNFCQIVMQSHNKSLQMYQCCLVLDCVVLTNCVCCIPYRSRGSLHKKHSVTSTAGSKILNPFFLLRLNHRVGILFLMIGIKGSSLPRTVLLAGTTIRDSYSCTHLYKCCHTQGISVVTHKE